MKKVIIKTAVITLAVLIALSGITFGGACLFAPASMRDFFRDAGGYKTAMSFAERAYEKNDSSENLQKAVELAILTQDNDKITVYCKKLLNAVSNGEVNLTVDYVYYVAGEYAVALCKNQNYENAVRVAFEYSSGYGKLNPCEKVILWGIENNQVELLQSVLQKITDFKQSYYDVLEQTAKDRLDLDIQNLTAYLNRE